MRHRIRFIRAEYERDVRLVHKWMQEEYVHPFWHLNIPFPAFEKHFYQAIHDPHQTLYLGTIDGTPMSYFEAYNVKGDVIESYYQPSPHDQGIHLLIGEPDYVGKGFAAPLLQAMTAFQFEQNKRTEKIVAEPDIRNEKMIHVFEKCGFERVKPVNLPDKTGLLMFCDRERFERKYNHDAVQQAK
ncbi:MULTISPECIES: GNAT family N-acetyltransferase [Bacillus]|uniref:Lysine N-acyltransferase MbtK n=1 Tax=Bacillus pumilus TaxID=1408 RepID=A0AAE4B8I7_BACPU|nr:MULTISPECIES: GNAT family N-acetyltransferase [Bacillus]AOC57226.1 GNAT family N-acetyltransferase [Bacillus pumilus]AZV51864.1 N-acetyltransferase [Bacillus pumilus]MBR0587602.1 acetyltransferase [Bacillus pumilus DW2J2]MBR0617392.1 acetyltransferase [Bacillus pumilus]MBR0621233.1 acetyltransferase [Bacillus pumilus]